MNGKHIREEELTAINISSPVIAKTFKKVKNRVENIRTKNMNDIESDFNEDTQNFNIT